MPRYIIKIDNLYAEWSTIVDSPISNFMTLDIFKEYYERKYGAEGMVDLPDRLKRVEEFGASYYTLEGVIGFNRAGKNEKHLTKEKLLKKYRFRRGYT